MTLVGSLEVVSATALSIEGLLTRCMAESGAFGQSAPRAFVVQTDDFGPGAPNQAFATSSTKISIFPYRIEVNAATRAAWSAVASLEGVIHLPLDLHLLVTAWASNAQTELQLVGHVMACLERTPVLSGPLLHPSGSWDSNEAIQVVQNSLDLESTLRVFDSLPVDYRMSVSYIARIARIDARDRIAPDTATAVSRAKATSRAKAGASA